MASRSSENRYVQSIYFSCQLGQPASAPWNIVSVNLYHMLLFWKLCYRWYSIFLNCYITLKCTNQISLFKRYKKSIICVVTHKHIYVIFLFFFVSGLLGNVHKYISFYWIHIKWLYISNNKLILNLYYRYFHFKVIFLIEMNWWKISVLMTLKYVCTNTEITY